MVTDLRSRCTKAEGLNEVYKIHQCKGFLITAAYGGLEQVEMIFFTQEAPSRGVVS